MSPPEFSAARLRADWETLCVEIGERRAGSTAERRAANYVAGEMQAAGLAAVRVEDFPCASLRSAQVDVAVRDGRHWKRVEAATLVGAPGTPRGRPIEGEMAWLELPEAGARLKPRSLRGRIAMVFGPLPTSVATHRRLLAATPLAVVHVDDRLPFSWTKNDGVYPHWARQGMPPTVTVPYREAWGWRRDGLRQIQLGVAVYQPPGISQNVVGELRGTSPELPELFITAHHDTQCGNPGADDNASGVVALLALARAGRGARPRRTVRFLSFGAEEQLSVGSSVYVREHRLGPAKVGLVLNFDAIASPLGHWVMSLAGPSSLGKFTQQQLAALGLDVRVQPEITPFSDHFPFNRAGIPSLFFMRANFPGGRWQHHSRHDTLENVSVDVMQLFLHGMAPLVATFAHRAGAGFFGGLPMAQWREARRIGRELFG